MTTYGATGQPHGGNNFYDESVPLETSSLKRNYHTPEQGGYTEQYQQYGHEEPSFKSLIKKQFAEGNWTYILHFLTFCSGAGLIVAGVLSAIPGFSGLTDAINPLHYITCGYLVLFGLVVIAVLIEFPPCWERWTWRWVPFLLTFRGRGFFLIFVGALAAGLNWTVGFIVGACVCLVGVINIVLACFYKNTLKKKIKFGDGPPDSVRPNRGGYEQT